MANYNVDKFKIGACVVSYKGNVLGATSGGVKVDLEMDTYDVKCDQAFQQVVKKVVTGVKLEIAIPLLEVDNGFALMLDGNGKITADFIGINLFVNGGALLLTPVNTTDKTGYNFPNAVIDPHFSYRFDSDRSHLLELKFTATANAGGVFMEKISVS